MANGVSFDGVHCLDDLGLVLTEATIGLPEVQTNYIEIPGRDGLLDATTALTGDVRYKNRTIEMTFETTHQYTKKEWYGLISEVATLLHGQEKKILFDGDGYYYLGRCSVGDFSMAGWKYSLPVTADCEPYKYSTEDSSVKTL